MPADHMDIGCVVFRPKLLGRAAFKADREPKDGCLCHDFAKALGAEQRWLKDSRSGYTYFYDNHTEGD